MEFDLLDRYLLDGVPSKAKVIDELLHRRSAVPGCAPFYQGIELLGPRTPDLTLFALRLVMAGKSADDSSVVRLRSLAERARANGAERETALEEYHRELQ